MIGLVKLLIENKVNESMYVAFQVSKIHHRGSFSFRFAFFGFDTMYHRSNSVSALTGALRA